MLGLKQYVLRYWETEFPNIKPAKNRAGNRVYKKRDIENFKIVQNLLHEKKFTIKGARIYLTKLKKLPIQDSNSNNIKNQKNKSLDLESLKKIKIGLKDLLDTMQNYK